MTSSRSNRSQPNPIISQASFPGSLAYDDDPLSAYNEDPTYLHLPLAALPIAIDVEPDLIDILHILPSDIVESILDLVSDKNTLKACTLVARAWAPRSRKHLMSMSIVRVDRVRAEAFVELLKSPWFSLWRIPSIELSFRGESSRICEEVVPLLRQHGVSVSWLTVVADSISTTGGSCASALPTISKMWNASLVGLVLRNFGSDRLKDVLPFVHSFRVLERLTMVGRFEGQRVAAKKLPRKLKSVTFRNGVHSSTSSGSGATEKVLHWLSSPKDGITLPLAELNIWGLGPGLGDFEELRRLLEGPNAKLLRELTLGSVILSGHDIIPDLRNLHSLRRFHIAPRLTAQITDTLCSIEKLLMSVSSEFLEEVILSIPAIPIEYLHEAQFRRIDEAFQDFPALKGVKKFVVEVSRVGVVVLESWFGKSVRRGIVEFVVVA
ncbi:hypothetical protein L218DRAFT_1002806 [Marasmius fiardii PR-910]|nr:hypothetical protein L218DRAFT_1002806 [Marasmius fiardii PR-910]